MDDTTETTDNPQPDQVPPPSGNATDLVGLTDEQIAFLTPYEEQGWKLKGRRRILLMAPLSETLVIDLGRRAAAVDVELREKRQGKNARSAALQREKKEREGVISDRSRRLDAGFDELGRRMSQADLAEYSRHIAALRGDYDEFEQGRKDEITGLREELAKLETEQATLAQTIREGRGSCQVPVVDMADYLEGTVLSLRLDNLTEHSRRPLAEHERQLALFAENVPYPALSDDEYKLAIYGRISDAARGYAARVGLDLTESQARKVVRQMLPNEEIPMEDIEIQEDEAAANPNPDEPHDFVAVDTNPDAACDLCGEHRLFELHPDTQDRTGTSDDTSDAEAPIDDGRRFNVVFHEAKATRHMGLAKLLVEGFLAVDTKTAKAMLNEGTVLAREKTLAIAQGLAKRLRDAGALVSVDEAVLEGDGVLLDSTVQRIGKEAAAGE